MNAVCNSTGEETRLERRRDGQLWAVRGSQARPVRVTRCFPWSAPDRYISLRDDRRDEFALIEAPERLDESSRSVLEEALAEAGFLLEIVAVVGIDEEIEIRCWQVRTKHGPRRFQTRRDDWPRRVPGGGVLIRDVAGDLFYIPDPSRVDGRSRRLLEAFVD